RKVLRIGSKDHRGGGMCYAQDSTRGTLLGGSEHMSKSSAHLASIKEVRNYLTAEIERARTQLSPDQWQALLVGVSDQGEIGAFPCRLVLPFHYPASIAELDDYGPDHFTFPEKSWELRWREIPEFAEQYEVFAALDDDAESTRVSDRHKQRRILVLQ